MEPDPEMGSLRHMSGTEETWYAERLTRLSALAGPATAA
jgi:hypothetical protein